jgi:hypothetical protein
MIDLLHLPKQQNGTIDYFPGFSNTDGGSWEIWNKPRGISFIKIITISGGEGGQGGGTGIGGAGPGGNSGSVTTVMMPAIFLPDRLYVSSGVGGFAGNGGSSSTGFPGGSGVASYVSIAQSTAAIYVVCYSNGSGTLTAATIANALQAGQGNFTALAGQAGATAGGNITYPTTGLLLSGGAGGRPNAGTPGVITAPASQTSTYNIFQTLSAGANGIENFQLLLSTGGAGGGNAAKGGNAGFGSGGGGGGYNVSGTGGDGGKGGNGLVIISCW